MGRPGGGTPVAPSFPGFEVLGILGRGGMGAVYKARDLRRGDIVALKTLPALEPDALYRFKQEFRALADMSHPNLAALYELHSVNERWFFTMEWVPGVSFLRYVRGDDRLDVPKLRSALWQLAQGVQALHDAGKLHCDLKPPNVLVTEAGRLVLLDFGLVTERNPQRYSAQNAELYSTVGYIPPEQLKHAPPSPATDWYATGVMLFQALTGRMPFEGAAQRIFQLQVSTSAPAPSDVAPGVPADLSDLCVGLLEREPQRRTGGAEVLAYLAGPERPAVRAVRSSRTNDGPLVGRGRQMALLHNALAEAKQGNTVVAAVQGLAGLGKSQLVSRFLDSLAGQRDLVVMAGRCYEQEAVPFKAIDGAIDELSRFLEQVPTQWAKEQLPDGTAALARVFPVLRRSVAVRERITGWHDPIAGWRGANADPTELRRQAFDGLRQLFINFARYCVPVLAIDDLHWGDADSAKLLTALLRPPAVPVLLIACYRSDYADSVCVKALAGAELASVRRVEVPVEPLTSTEAGELARWHLRSADPSRVEAVARAAGGNPLFVSELARFAERAAGDQPVDLAAALRQRISQLPAEATRVLEVLAVAGRPLPVAVTLQAAGITGPARDALALLRAEHLVRTTGTDDTATIEPYHDRIRETVVADLSAAVRAERHRQLAATLSTGESAEDPERLAQHHHAAGNRAAAAAAYILSADRAAHALAFERAAEWYELALKLQPQEGRVGRAIRRKWGDALANAGRGVQAAWQYESACRGADATDTNELLRKAAYYACSSGHLGEGLQVLRTVVESVGQTLPANPAEAVQMHKRASWWDWWSGRGKTKSAEQINASDLYRVDVEWAAAVGLGLFDPASGTLFAARHLRSAKAVGDASRLARALAWSAQDAVQVGSSGRPAALRQLEQARKLAEPIGDVALTGLIQLAAGLIDYRCGLWRDARRWLEQADDHFRRRCVNVAWEQNTTQAYLLATLAHMGEFATLNRVGLSLQRAACDRNDRYALTMWGTYAEPLAHLADGNPAPAQQALHAVLADWDAPHFSVQHWAGLLAQTTIHLYQGHGVAAVDRWRAAWPLVQEAQLPTAQGVRVWGAYLQACAHLAVQALPAAQSARQRLMSESAPWAHALGQALQAAEAAHTQHARTADQYHVAAASLAAADMPAHAAACRRAAAVWLTDADGQAAADGTLRSLGVSVRPERLAAALVPQPVGQ